MRKYRKINQCFQEGWLDVPSLVSNNDDQDAFDKVLESVRKIEFFKKKRPKN